MSSLRRHSFLGIVIAALLPAAAAADWAGQPFSAEVRHVNGRDGSEMPGRVHVDQPGIRFEMVHAGQTGITIVDPRERKVYVLIPAERAYLVTDARSNPALRGLMERLLAPGAAAPCGGYRSGEDQGQEAVDGRPTRKWRCEEPNLPEFMTDSTVWFDEELQFPLRLRSDDGDLMEISAVIEGAQPEALFAIPAGYTRVETPLPGDAMGGAPGGMPPNMEEMMEDAMRDMTPAQREQFRRMMEEMMGGRAPGG